jgi:V8-like Glu-specific endopeptidase
MRVPISIVLAALAVAMLAPGMAAAGGSDAAAAARAEHDRIVAYWTPARMAAAKPKDFVRDANSGKLVPNAGKPGSGGGAVTGASWTGGGEINKRSGKLFFSTSGGNWQCSASVVNDASTSNSYSVILTAGHCTYDGSEGWSYNVLYIPDYDFSPTKTCSATHYGCWTADREAVATLFVSEGGFGSEKSVEVDYGFMRMKLGGTTTNTLELDAVTGGYDINTSSLLNSVEKWAFGYPAQGKYKGKDLTYCKGQTIDDPYGADTWGVACNMTPGSSGGPWIYGTSNPAVYTAATKLTSLNSYGYSGLSYMFGPKFAPLTQTTADVAASGSAAGVTSHTIP